MRKKQMTFEECWEIQGVTCCVNCSIYEKCCEYGDEKRAELDALNNSKETSDQK